MEITLTAPSVGLAYVDASTQLRRTQWCLRIAAAACFIGHGAFGIITKAAWLPYFAVVGIAPDIAYRLMPIIGTIDIVAGIVVLISPRPIALLYMVCWATMTALLRPIAGESVFEALERAGNYGAPLALFLLLGRPRSFRGLVDRFGSDFVRADAATVGRVLHLTTVVLLAAHGALAVFTRKPVFAQHYASIGLSATFVPFIGYAEILAALAVLLAPIPALLFTVAIWKMLTEALYPVSGTPIWEFVERGGSYGAPLALALLCGTAVFARITFQRSTR